MNTTLKAIKTQLLNVLPVTVSMAVANEIKGASEPVAGKPGHYTTSFGLIQMVLIKQRRAKKVLIRLIKANDEAILSPAEQLVKLEGSV